LLANTDPGEGSCAVAPPQNDRLATGSAVPSDL